MSNINVSAAILIIGDEVLNGKITDTNSRYFAKYCYNLGIPLREISTIGDDLIQIETSIKRLSLENDLIVTSGGIGSTHDDITYESISKAFNLPCLLNQECVARMERINQPTKRFQGQALKDHYRMATLPTGDIVKNYYVDEKMWVPVCSIDKKVYILPGIPQLFEKLLELMKPNFQKIYQLKDVHYLRYFVKTPYGESYFASFLRELQENANKVSKNIKLGSYPHFGMGFNTISILGSESDKAELEKIKKLVIAKLKGEEVSSQDEDNYSNQRKDKL
ncbi:related to 3^-phosphoadenosine 5^-phosphosulfate sulfotransferase (PAPS reductase)/FAD synthetase and related enzymes [Saccharomycodes ludwigii]|uniref:Related to 3^-phosphoadenosine 5^-phosphosulfate sulfotransferase (PAPS reductase)/FAD synthetase and related enzymes n=1 Tax=Saccharomycodes ludwigii TaxID=36035 RepID=A0A376B9F6_9ASCO|nr:hypothetical protein SCDLUD_001139 [Saccharomycodes ludwigii]KAH3903499.1 hypothetical protein SCDLUD_001139 [Saccharomycodes ludwigii]SSD61306.1 related to 3^-phosphoadenosine 5^-phosphosulfate sulfotransferase (PAPS reductase)/FAD synthetase and related enzymes [Saccharomycodes ludwigii]